MKKRFLLCTAALLFTCFVLVAQSVPSEVVTAFRDGNSTGIKPFLCESVELIMLNKSQNCTAQAAENSLRDFFSSHRVLDFTVNPQGNRDDSSFMIGTLNTQQEKFRVNCFLKRERGTYLIFQIRLDKIND